MGTTTMGTPAPRASLTPLKPPWLTIAPQRARQGGRGEAEVQVAEGHLEVGVGGEAESLPVAGQRLGDEAAVAGEVVHGRGVDGRVGVAGDRGVGNAKGLSRDAAAVLHRLSDDHV